MKVRGVVVRCRRWSGWCKEKGGVCPAAKAHTDRNCGFRFCFAIGSGLPVSLLYNRWLVVVLQITMENLVPVCGVRLG